MRGLEARVDAPIDDLPAGGLDLAAQAVGLRPVAGLARLGPVVGRGKDGLGDVRARHPSVPAREGEVVQEGQHGRHGGGDVGQGGRGEHRPRSLAILLGGEQPGRAEHRQRAP